MTYDEAKAFLDTTKQYGSVLGLTSIRDLMADLGDVQETLSIIHVAGTNGKGSVCAMIAEILKEAGYLVGRYSSPAVFSYEEIYQVNGASISHADYAKCMESVMASCGHLTAAGKPHPTAFEIETALAFLYFANQQCDFVILETGMGGATDATNLISSPVCSVLTDISRDHMGFLGDSLAEIAGVKAGIIKQGRPVVMLCQKPEAMAVIEERAKQLNAELILAKEDRICSIRYNADGMEIVCDGRENEKPFHEEGGQAVRAISEKLRLHLLLTGAHQVRNALLALTVSEALCDMGYHIFREHVLAGFEKARWAGRFETIHKEPRIIIDGAHNEGAAEKLKDTIENCFTNQPITYIIGVLADKEHEKMLRLLLPYAKKVYAVTPDNPRALSGEALYMEAQKYHSDVTCAESVGQAVACAVANAGKEEVILAFGSLSYLGQVKEAVKQL